MPSVNRNVLTLDEFRNKETRSLPHATGELSNLLRDIGLAAKRINVEVNKAGLVDIFGDAGFNNVQGESVKILDEFANREFTEVLRRGVSCAGVASEEMEDILPFEDRLSQGSKYVCLFDPLDGSSNIDVNISIGTIFAIYRRITKPGTKARLEDFLQRGAKLVAAGYIIYGSSTMLVYATKRGVNGFTLDPSTGEFCLSHPSIQCPANGMIYSINHGNIFDYPEPVQIYIRNLQQCNDKKYTQRYTGSMVADLHRNIIKGGIFLYPDTGANPGGKLRLLYECNPFAFILEMAGGKAISSMANVLDICPDTLHQRIPFYAGSRHMVDDLRLAMDNAAE